MYRLVFLSGRYEGRRLVVRQAVALVGRDAECHLFLPDDPLLAPRHARLEERGTGVYLSSLSPGTPVERNGQPVLDAVRLAHNDLLVIGQTRVQFQDIIAPHARLRPSPGLLQPATILIVSSILALEAGLLYYLIDWPLRLIRPEIEAADLAWAEAYRAARAAEKGTTNGAAPKAAGPGSVMTLPGTEPAPEAATATNGAAPVDAAPGTPAASAAVIAVLDQADFTPADTNTPLEELPPVSAADPAIAEAQRLLAEAVAAAQFADYPQATRLLNQIHQTAPGFLPAHAEHARLLEARGDLDGARQRWTQILGLAPADSPFREEAIRERQRLAKLRELQTRILPAAGTPDLANLARQIRIAPPDVQKMPGDSDISEMRILNTTLELAAGAAVFPEAAVQVFLTFYDADETGEIVRPTRAIATPSPIVLDRAFADRGSVPVSATYVVPRGLRDQEQRETGRRFAFYGYTLHVFAGQILQDAAAKPKKLLDRPIHFPAAEE